MADRHDHIFLGDAHENNERAVWAVIALTSVMMVVEIVGGWMFGSIALVADGFHMSTHAGALLLAALAYGYARRRATDPAFTFGTGKLGDLAGFSSALILAMIALGIAYEAALRLLAPTPIDFAEAIPIATLGLVVNIVSAWLLSRRGHDHHHHHGHDHNHDHDDMREDAPVIAVGGRSFRLEIREHEGPARFRLAPLQLRRDGREAVQLTTVRPGGARQYFRMIDHGGYFESSEEIPEPHAFEVLIDIDGFHTACSFEEHEHRESVGRDNNMRAALLHVIADAAVSVIVIAGLLLAEALGWLWMDPLAGLIGAGVIASWSYQLVRDTGGVLLDINPDPSLTIALRKTFERDGDKVLDLHLWRLGPGHLGAILSIETSSASVLADYRARALALSRFSHLTIEIARRVAVRPSPSGTLRASSQQASDSVDNELDGQRSEHDAEHPGEHDLAGRPEQARHLVGEQESDETHRHRQCDDGH